MKKYTSIIVYSLVLILVTALAASGVTYLVVQAGQLRQGESVTISLDEYGILKSYERLEVLRKGLHDSFYQDVDDALINEGAAYGMVSSLGDPYSTYLNAEQMEALFEEDKGEYVGIGATFLTDPTSGVMTITRIYPGSPISKTDAAVGDTLYSVNGEVVVGMDQTSVAAIIKGDEGTSVTVALKRDTETTEYVLTREKVEIIDVEYRMLEDGMLLVQVFSFSTRADTEFEKALKYGREQKMTGLILDLRNNGGGSGAIVKNIADPLLPEGTIFYTENKKGEKEVLKSDARSLGLPLVVLCNEASASASEILVAAVQDYKVGTIVGTTTFGKAIGQSTIQLLEDGAGLYLTTVTVHSPLGRNWQGVGLTPDVEVDLPDELKQNPLLLNDENDLQLKEAITQIKNQIAAGG